MDAMNQAAHRRVEAGGLKNPPPAPKCVQTHFQRVSRFFSAIHRTFTLAVGFNPPSRCPTRRCPLPMVRRTVTWTR